MSVEIRTPAAITPLEANARLARLSDVALPPLNPDSDRWPGRTVRVAGVDIFVRHTPGPDGAERALLVHGLGGASTNWTDFAGLLASRLDVEALDLPGFGYSGRAKDDNYSIAMQAATVIAYLDSTKQNSTADNQSWRGPVHLVGNSMGGLIAIEVAARRPDLVRSLTLISPAVPDLRRLRFHPLQNDRLMALVIVPGLGEYGVRRLMKTEVEERARGTLRICFADPSRYPANRFAQDIEDINARTTERPWMHRVLLKATRALARVQYLNRGSVWKRIATISAPTLVLWGDKDKLVAPDLAAPLAAAIPNARFRVFDNVGHTAMTEDPEQTARAFFGLLEDVASSTQQR